MPMCKWCGKDREEKCFQIVKNTYVNIKGVSRTNITRRKVCIKCMNNKHTKDYVTKQRKEMGDYYMKFLIHCATKIPVKMITQELIILKRKSYELRKKTYPYLYKSNKDGR